MLNLGPKPEPSNYEAPDFLDQKPDWFEPSEFHLEAYLQKQNLKQFIEEFNHIPMTQQNSSIIYGWPNEYIFDMQTQFFDIPGQTDYTDAELIKALSYQGSLQQSLLYEDQILNVKSNETTQQNDEVLMTDDEFEEKKDLETDDQSVSNTCNKHIFEITSSQLSFKDTSESDIITQPHSPSKTTFISKPIRKNKKKKQTYKKGFNYKSEYKTRQQKFICEFCDRVFQKPQALGGHVSKAHPFQSEVYQKKIQIRKDRKVARDILSQAKKIYLSKYGTRAIINRTNLNKIRLELWQQYIDDAQKEKIQDIKLESDKEQLYESLKAYEVLQIRHK